MYLIKNNKSSFYQLVYFQNGKRTTISTKETTKQAANKFMIQFQKEFINHSKLQFKNVTLKIFNDEYLDYVRITKSKYYIRSIETSFKFLIRFFGDIQLNNLDIRNLDRFFISLSQKTPRGVFVYYRTLKAGFSKAVQWNYIPENPFKRIKLKKPSKTFPVFISETELQTILEKTEEKFLKDLFYTAFYTGMRLGEIVNMKWTWIDFNQDQITVHCSEQFTTKSKKERIIPFNQNLKTYFVNRFPKVLSILNDDYVFSKLPGIKLNEDFISKKFKCSVRAARLDEKIHFHTLRHSFASLLVQRGVSLYVVKELLGHEALSTTQIYSHLQKQNLRDAVNLL